MDVGLVKIVDIDQEMQQSYLDYAMSVIVSRALPDARDGLKPVHRRILYAMYDMGLRVNTPYKKSARIVGEVLGKYHPHGDMAVYDAMARMAQNFSMRYPLIDGQGNFGSVDGDSPAAMRYTEARIAPLTNHLLLDIHKDTVDFSLNFDDSLEEPDVLPAAFPNMLVNGATGIAVGMSTSIPPHNLGEVVDALKYMIQNWTRLDTVTVENLIEFIKGPDFPTGGTIIQDVSKDGGLIRAYGTGRGRIRVRANVHIEEMSRGRHRLLVTELPYMTNKSSLIERIAHLARDGKIDGIADLRDESDRQGMRIVIELTKTVDPKDVLLELFKRTPMQTTFSIIMLALVDGEPRLLSLKQSLRVYIQHRLDMIRLRSEYDLRKAREKEHILEGLRVALRNLDAVIEIIRRSRTVETAHSKLKSRYKLSDRQVKAILDLPLRRLASLERKKIEDDYRAVKAEIRRLEALLRSPKKVRGVVVEELEAIKEEYADRRKTRIVSINGKQSEEEALTITDMTPDSTVWVMVSKDGYISRTLGKKPPRLGGSDAPHALLKVNTRDTLYLVSQDGEASSLLVQSLPEASKPSDGAPIAQITPFTKKEIFSAAFTLPPKADQGEDWFVIACTRGGMVKKTALSELPGPSAKTFPIIKVNQGDRLGWVRLTDGKKDIVLVSSKGMAIRFNEEDVRPMGLVAAGVMGIKLKVGDEVIGMELFPGVGELFLLASDGKAKRIIQSDFPCQGRYGQGVTAWKLPKGVGLVGIALGKGTGRAILRLAKYADKGIRLDDAPIRKRSTISGKSILDIRSGDRLIDIVAPWDVPRPLSKVKKKKSKR